VPGWARFQFRFCSGPASDAELAGPVPVWKNGAGNPMQGANMPLVDIQLIRGVFTPEQKNNMIKKVTDAIVAVEGEAMRQVTWVRVQETESGEWAIGGKPLTAADVKAMAGGGLKALAG